MFKKIAQFFKDDYKKTPSKKTTLFNRIIGPLLTLVLVIIHNMLHFYGHEVPNMTGAFAILIVFSIFTGELFSGIFVLSVTTVYTGYHMIFHECKNYTHFYDFLVNPINTVVFFAVALMAGINRRQVSQYMKDLELREQKYSMLFHSANDMVFLMEIHQNGALGKILEVNDIACDKLGYSKQELLDMTTLDVTAEGYRQKTMIHLKEILSNGHLTYEKELLTKQGIYIPVEINSTAFIHNGIKFVFAIARDLSERRRSEEKLRLSEERNRQLVELSPDGIFIHNEGIVTYANPALLKMLKASRLEDVIGKSVTGFIHPGYHNAAKKRISTLYTDAKPIRLIEEQIIALDGSIIDIEATATLLPGTDNTVVYGIARNITKRKQIEKEIIESEKKFRLLFNNTNDAIFMHTLADSLLDDRFTEINDFACEMLEYSRDELLSMSPRSIVLEGSISNESLHLLLKNNRNTFEGSMVTKTGTLIPVEISSHIIELNNKKCVLSVVRDNTERKKAETQLRQSEERYRQLVELSPDAIVVHRNGIFTFSNNAGLKLFGASASNEIIGRHLLDFIHRDYLDLVNNRLKYVYEGGRPAPLSEQKIVQLNGNIIDVEVTTGSFIDNNGLSIIAIVRDTTEKRKAEALRKSVAEKDRLLKETLELDRIRTEFFANISHELRTPLTLIYTTLQMFEMHLNRMHLQEEDLPVKKYSNIIRQNVYRLLRLINNLIDITKIDAGYMEFNPGNYNIVSLVEDIALSVAGFVETRGLYLQFDTDTEEKMITCDPDKIERIILNLISNAVKFTDEGGSIYVNILDKGDKVLICVEDTGIGIPEDKRSFIFDRFRQVEKLLTRNQEGSGIGLSIVKSMVEMHGGNISLESKLGSGSKFIIELPALRNSTSAEGSSDSISLQAKRKIDIIEIEFSDIYK